METLSNLVQKMEEYYFNHTYVCQSHDGNGTQGSLCMPGSSDVKHFRVFLNATASIFGLLSILFNIVFVLALRFVEDKSSAHYHYIHSLAMADIFAALTFLITSHWPHLSFKLIDPRKYFVLGHSFSYVFRSIPWLFFTAYMLTLCCLTLNQYIAVCKPWRYSQLLTPKTIKITLAIVWCISSLQLFIPIAMVSVLQALEKDKKVVVGTLFKLSYWELHAWMSIYVISLLINIVLETLAYLKLKDLKMRRHRSNTNMGQLSLQIMHQSFVTLSLLLCASIFCRLPFPIMSIVGLNIEVSCGMSAVELIDSCIVFLLYSNFLIDPVILVSRTTDVKTMFRMFFTVCKKKYKCCYQTTESTRRRGETWNLVSINVQ